MITVLGASGFIGSHVIDHLRRSGTAYQAPARDEPLTGRHLGDVIYCVGLTADFRERPYDTVEAHVTRLVDIVRQCSFDSLLYLSSTRVYANADGPAHEDADLQVNPLRPDDLYNLSKLAGESIVLSLPAGRGRVARLSHVYGAGQSQTFLSMVLDEANEGGIVRLRSGLRSTRDYVSVVDSAALLVRIAMGGRERIYNIASGILTSNADVIDAIGCAVEVEPGAPDTAYPSVDTTRIRAEFGFEPRRLLDDLPALLGSGT